MENNLEKYLNHAGEWMNAVSKEMEVGRDKAFRITRSILHSIRNQISIDESFHLMSQMPMLWKGMYVDGWNLNLAFERKHHLHDWLDSIRDQDGGSAALDFGNDMQMRTTISAFFHALSKKMNRESIIQLANLFTEEIQNFLKQSVYEESKVIE
jgi:uncharacterized protein (DUF2267 family)